MDLLSLICQISTFAFENIILDTHYMYKIMPNINYYFDFSIEILFASPFASGLLVLYRILKYVYTN